MSSVINLINKGRPNCKGNTWTERRDGLLIHRCDKCSLHWTMPAPAAKP